jgi:hypothetical protein
VRRWSLGQGNIITMRFRQDAPSNMVYYTLNEYGSWMVHQFSEEKMLIEDVTALHKGFCFPLTRIFVVWVTAEDLSKSLKASFILDFADLLCEYSEL